MTKRATQGTSALVPAGTVQTMVARGVLTIRAEWPETIAAACRISKAVSDVEHLGAVVLVLAPQRDASPRGTAAMALAMVAARANEQLLAVVGDQALAGLVDWLPRRSTPVAAMSREADARRWIERKLSW